jgi:Flp pilus assembly protein CpaB
MRSRGLVVAIAVVLAVLAAVGVIVYTSSVRENATSENTTQVVTSSQDIPANTPLTPLVQSNVFRLTAIPNDAVVPDAVTDISTLDGAVTSAPIYQNEQIPQDRLSTGPGSNNLGISDGNVGVGLEVQGAAAVNGYVQQGSYVVLYATFHRGTLVSKQSLKFFLSGAQIQKLQTVGSPTGSSPNLIFMPTDFTFALVPSVHVLAVTNPPADTSTGKPTAGTSDLVLDMTPPDASNLIFAVDHATIYLGLLPPGGDKGYANPGTLGPPLARVVGVNKG